MNLPSSLPAAPGIPAAASSESPATQAPAVLPEGGFAALIAALPFMPACSVPAPTTPAMPMSEIPVVLDEEERKLLSLVPFLPMIPTTEPLLPLAPIDAQPTEASPAAPQIAVPVAPQLPAAEAPLAKLESLPEAAPAAFPALERPADYAASPLPMPAQTARRTPPPEAAKASEPPKQNFPEPAARVLVDLADAGTPPAKHPVAMNAPTSDAQSAQKAQTAATVAPRADVRRAEPELPVAPKSDAPSLAAPFARSEAPVPADAPQPVTPVRAVLEPIFDTAVRMHSDGSNRVELTIDLQDGETLQLTLERHGESIRLHFRGESTGLRQAMEHGWTRLTERLADQGIRIDAPVFESRSGMSSGNGDQRQFSEQEQQRRRQQPESEPAFPAPNFRGRPTFPRASATPVAASSRSLHAWA